MHGAENLTIEGAGTTLIFSDRDGTTWSFDSCRNIVLRGFTLVRHAQEVTLEDNEIWNAARR